MTFLTSYPTARSTHRCEGCYRTILPGEQYVRGFDTEYRSTFKTCAHCDRCGNAWSRHGGDYEWDWDCINEWLEEEHPSAWAGLRANWRYPDGEIMPLPLQPCCIACGGLLSSWRLWCEPCDVARIERLNDQFASLAGALS